VSLSYDTGLEPAVAAGVIVSGAAFVAWIVRRSPPLFLGLSAGFAAFVTTYSVANLLLQPHHLSTAVLEEEIRNGRLGLRVASVMVGARAIALAFEVYREGPRRVLRDYFDIEAFGDEDTRKERTATILRHGCMYTSVMAGLWVLVSLDRTSPAIAALNWLVTFIVDDWAIVSHYNREHGVATPRRYELQFSLVNAVLLGLLGVVMFDNFATGVAFAATAYLALAFVIVPFATSAYHALASFGGTVGILPEDQLDTGDYIDFSKVDDPERLREEIERVRGQRDNLRGDLGGEFPPEPDEAAMLRAELERVREERDEARRALVRAGRIV
jgi:hypothetical protein